MRSRRRRSTSLREGSSSGNPLAAGLLGACAVVQVGIGIYFIFSRPPLLPEDLRFLALGPAGDESLVRLRAWLDLVFTVMGGQMAAVGALAAAMALRVRSAGPSSGEVVCVLLAGAASAGLMSAVNFALGSDFRWLLILPAGLWGFATVAVWRAFSTRG